MFLLKISNIFQMNSNEENIIKILKYKYKMDIVYWLMNLSPEFLQKFGYFLIFWFISVEWIPPLWVFSPWQFVMLFGGFLSKIWIFNIFILIIIWFVWSFLGDLVWYLMWKKLWYPFLEKYGKYIFVKRKSVEKTQNMLNKHFFKAVFFSRFYGWTRVITPFICWVSRISLNKFLLGSGLSCLSWSIFWPLVWYIFGQSYDIAGERMWKFMFFAMVFWIFMIFAYRYVNKKRHIFNKEYLYTLATNILSFIILAKLADEVAWHESIIRIDNFVNFKINLISSWFLDNLMIGINNVWNLYVLIWLSLLFLWYLIYKKKKYHYRLFILGNVGWFVIDIFMKAFIGRLRPDNALIFLKDYSFPSGHAAMSTILFLTIWLIFEKDIKSKWHQFGFFLLCLLPVLLIGFSRIYLNVHWFSDVIGWFFLWVFWITFMILLIRFIMANKLDKDTINIP